MKDRRHGLILKAWPSKIPTFEMLKLKADKLGFHELRNEWRAGSYVVDGEVVIPEDSAGSSP